MILLKNISGFVQFSYVKAAPNGRLLIKEHFSNKSSSFCTILIYVNRYGKDVGRRDADVGKEFPIMPFPVPEAILLQV